MGISREDFFSLTVHSRIYGFGEMNCPRIHKIEHNGNVWICWPQNGGTPQKLTWDGNKNRAVLADGSYYPLVERLSSEEVFLAKKDGNQLVNELVDEKKIDEETAKLLKEAIEVSCREAMEYAMLGH